jgi:predicted nucleotidyltransferase
MIVNSISDALTDFPAAISATLAKAVPPFSRLPEVDGILMAGSFTSGTGDDHSDIDLYVYLNAELPAQDRKAIVSRLSSDFEIDNRFWETEDCFVVTETGVKVEMMYRGLEWMRGQLERVLDRYEGSVGYSTCLVHNYLTSRILFDRTGSLGALRRRYDRPYPDALIKAILAKNRPLLKECSSSFYAQIALAVRREDWISVNHRTSALLASYFDILFAMNRRWHPGEKKLMRLALRDCAHLPRNFEGDIAAVLQHTVDAGILEVLDTLIRHLEELLA